VISVFSVLVVVDSVVDPLAILVVGVDDCFVEPGFDKELLFSVFPVLHPVESNTAEISIDKTISIGESVFLKRTASIPKL
jgi:hypothetical protein